MDIKITFKNFVSYCVGKHNIENLDYYFLSKTSETNLTVHLNDFDAEHGLQAKETVHLELLKVLNEKDFKVEVISPLQHYLAVQKRQIEVEKKSSIENIKAVLKMRKHLDIDFHNTPVYEEINDNEQSVIETISSDGGVKINIHEEEPLFLNLEDLTVDLIAEIEYMVLNSEYDIIDMID